MESAPTSLVLVTAPPGALLSLSSLPWCFWFATESQRKSSTRRDRSRKRRRARRKPKSPKRLLVKVFWSSVSMPSFHYEPSVTSLSQHSTRPLTWTCPAPGPLQCTIKSDFNLFWQEKIKLNSVTNFTKVRMKNVDKSNQCTQKIPAARCQV